MAGCHTTGAGTNRAPRTQRRVQDGDEEALITRDELTAIIAECMALQMPDASTGYDTEIAIDSFSFVWLQHVLGERFGYDLQPPGSDVMQTLNSARALHRYLAEISPGRFTTPD